MSAYADVPSHSPWVAQLAPDGPPRPLTEDTDTDVVIVGAGIAGVATAFFALRETRLRVLLLERDRVARGATGHNAGQLTTYFERSLHDIASEFGLDRAVDAQRSIDGAQDLLDLMVAESGAAARIERFSGHMGMRTLNHVQVHLRNNQLRWAGGLRVEACLVSEEAEWLSRIPREFAHTYAVVPQAAVNELLEVEDDRFRAVLSDRKGCANSGALTQQVLAYLEQRHPARFRYADSTGVERVTVAREQVVVEAGGHRVTAAHVVMCTNGFVDHEVVDEHDHAVALADDQQIEGTVGYMAAFVEDHPRAPAAMSYIRNDVIGGDTPYVYVTRRTYDRTHDTVTLTCMGAEDHPLEGRHYDRTAPFPGPRLDYADAEVRPFAQPSRPPGRAYDFHWHGLMGYNDSMIRVIGAHPDHARLMYNLGCNGVGFLPSVYGGQRIAELLAGRVLSPTIFDPR